jgi:hypothetical protein
MRVNFIAGILLCLLSAMVLPPVKAAPKGQDMSCASLSFLNACALNGGVVSCSKGTINGRPETTALCCKSGASGSRVCSDDPNDIARGAVAPSRPGAGIRAPMQGQSTHSPAKSSGIQKTIQ